MSFYAIFYLLFIQTSLVLPGYVVFKKTRWLDKLPGVQLCMAYVTTIVFFSFLATMHYIFNINPAILRVLAWVTLGASVFLFVKERYYLALWKLRFPLICTLAMSLLAVAFVGLTFNQKYSYLPDPTPLPQRNYKVLNVKVLNIAQTQANDNYIPYRQAQFFVNRSDPGKDSFIDIWGVTFFQRTPLMGALTANYFTMLSDKPPVDFTWSTKSNDQDYTYIKFQIISSVLNTLFIIPSFFLLIKLFNKKTALISCLFLVISSFFLFNTVFSWPKSLVAFFILISWLLILENKMRYTLLAGVVSGIAYLTHDLAVLYMGASVLLLLYNKRFKETLWFCLTIIGFAIPWLFTAGVLYHKPSTFIYYPISIRGIPQPSEKQAIVHQFLHTSPLRILLIRIENLIYLLSPYQLLTSEGGQGWARRIWALGLFSILGATGLGLIIPMVISTIKNLKKIDFWILALTPVVMSLIVIGWIKGVGAIHMAEAIVVLFTGCAVSFLAELQQRRWLILAYTATVGQLFFFIDYSYRYSTGVWFTNIKDMLSLLYIVGLSAACGWLLYRIATQKNIWIAEQE